MENAKNILHHGDVWAARFQSAGRGQRGNVWCSDAGQNLTFSVFLVPEALAAADQFYVCQAISLGICGYLESKGVLAAVKWPNDIYVGDRKICGILIEHSVAGGTVKNTLAGIGLNLNQTEFPDWIPNPTSLKLETGADCDPEDELEPLLGHIFAEFDAMPGDAPERYLERLYLRGIPHSFTVAATGERFSGRIKGTAPDGRLIIEAPDGERLFAFKEVIY